MPRRSPAIDPELKTHQEWLGYLQPVGLVVAPAAMVDAGLVVTRRGVMRSHQGQKEAALALPLALNAERYAEEVAQGLHGKGGKKQSTAAPAGGKRRGRPAKAANSADTEQIGLAL